jgi:hypothetical protein
MKPIILDDILPVVDFSDLPNIVLVDGEFNPVDIFVLVGKNKITKKQEQVCVFQRTDDYLTLTLDDLREIASTHNDLHLYAIERGFQFTKNDQYLEQIVDYLKPLDYDNVSIQ